MEATVKIRSGRFALAACVVLSGFCVGGVSLAAKHNSPPPPYGS